MNYALDTSESNSSLKKAGFKALWPYLKKDQLKILMAFFAIVINSSINLIGPFFMGYALDHTITKGDLQGTLNIGMLLLGLYLISFFASYIQTIVMGTVAQNLLFTLRNVIFNKLQLLPLAFFNQNKAGDLISRINNDTDKLNQFFSQSLVQFIANLFMMVGTAIFLVTLNPKLGTVTLLPALFLLIFTQLISAWIRRKNAQSLQATGGMSAEIQESLDNFKVIVAFNRRDYFRKKFEKVNEINFQSSLKAAYANTLFVPIYTLSSTIAQLLVLTYGIHLIISGSFSIGLLISYLSYSTRFYDPLRHMAALWASFQTAMASWDRISVILKMESTMRQLKEPKEEAQQHTSTALLEFKDVSFSYPDGKEVLHQIDFALEPGKIYAFVGPTGGGKTTTASLMSRLFDPTKGEIRFKGKDIRSISSAMRAKKIGFILQDPFLFTGTVRENLIYGNTELKNLSSDHLEKRLEEYKLSPLLTRFDDGLETKVESSGNTLSLGQRQLIAFVRAMLRQPELLILDEATANIDTITEKLLEETLENLPKKTTRVVIAHRLSTIESADEIFFINAGQLTRAGSLEHAVELLLHGKRES